MPCCSKALRGRPQAVGRGPHRPADEAWRVGSAQEVLPACLPRFPQGGWDSSPAVDSERRSEASPSQRLGPDGSGWATAGDWVDGCGGRHRHGHRSRRRVSPSLRHRRLDRRCLRHGEKHTDIRTQRPGRFSNRPTVMGFLACGFAPVLILRGHDARPRPGRDGTTGCEGPRPQAADAAPFSPYRCRRRDACEIVRCHGCWRRRAVW